MRCELKLSILVDKCGTFVVLMYFIDEMSLRLSA